MSAVSGASLPKRTPSGGPVKDRGFTETCSGATQLPLSPVMVAQGSEPPAFTANFMAWRPYGFTTCTADQQQQQQQQPLGRGGGNTLMIERQPLRQAGDAHQNRANAVRPGPPSKVLGLAELQHVPRDRLPPGVDPSCREAHISDTDFELAFKCSRSEFDAMPGWKKTVKRKDAGLF